MTKTHVDEELLITSPQVEQNGSFVQVGHVGHILNHEVLGGVHLLDVIFLEGLGLVKRRKWSG